MNSVLNTLSEYTYFYILKKTTLLHAVFKRFFKTFFHTFLKSLKAFSVSLIPIRLARIKVSKKTGASKHLILMKVFITL